MIFGAGLSGGGEQRSQIAFHRGGYGPGAGHWGDHDDKEDNEKFPPQPHSSMTYSNHGNMPERHIDDDDEDDDNNDDNYNDDYD